jgi:hypothetical protein
MIKRIFEPDELKKLVSDIAELDPPNYHNSLSYNFETIYRTFAHKSILAWDFFLWGNIENDKYNGYIAFFNDKSERFNESIFQEYGWFSSNERSGYKLLATALKFAQEKQFDCVTMSSVTNNPQHPKLQKFYEKMGFKEDSVTYIAKL